MHSTSEGQILLRKARKTALRGIDILLKFLIERYSKNWPLIAESLSCSCTTTHSGELTLAALNGGNKGLPLSTRPF